jgi:hypothetical protein
VRSALQVLDVELFNGEDRLGVLFHGFLSKVNRIQELPSSRGLSFPARSSVQIVASTDVGVADEYLRHGTLFGFQHHFIAPLGIEIDTYLSICVTPRSASSFLARMQYGQTAVVYIRT